MNASRNARDWLASLGELNHDRVIATVLPLDRNIASRRTMNVIATALRKLAKTQAIILASILPATFVSAADVRVEAYDIFCNGDRVGKCVMDRTPNSIRFAYFIKMRYRDQVLQISCGRDSRKIWQQIGDLESSSACYVRNPDVSLAIVRDVQMPYRGFIYGPFNHLGHVHAVERWIENEEKAPKNEKGRYETVIDLWGYDILLDDNETTIIEMSVEYIGGQSGPPRPVPQEFTYKRTGLHTMKDYVFSGASLSVVTPLRDKSGKKNITPAAEQRVAAESE